MSEGSQQAITHVLQQDSKVLGLLFAKIHLLKELNNFLAGYIDPKLAKHCQVANLENNHLVVMTNNAIWATQFRFQMTALLPKMRLHPALTQLKSIQCKIVPVIGQSAPPAPAETFPMSRISLYTSTMIQDTAKTIKHDRLRAIMNKISHYTD